MLIEGGLVETKYMMSHREGVLEKKGTCEGRRECVHERVKECVLESVKGSPQPNPSWPKGVFRQVSWAKSESVHVRVGESTQESLLSQKESLA